MGLTSAQRYNKRADEIWEEARKLGAFSKENLKKAREHEEKMRLKAKMQDAKLKKMLK
ncbi:MAG: hypothetical protein KAJ49_06025 [Arcobacteraceae bacterium]|nr:hypothetical protein [Arcobacteraceae bacterium]